MNTESTSLEPVNSAPAQWQHFARFIQRPALPDQTTYSQDSFGARFGAQLGSGLKAVLRMLTLDMTIMVALLSLVLVYILTVGDLPSNALNDLELTPGVILAIVIGAPLGEELVFRRGYHRITNCVETATDALVSCNLPHRILVQRLGLCADPYC